MVPSETSWTICARREWVGVFTIEAVAPGTAVSAGERRRQARWATAAIFFLLGAIFGSWAARIPAVQARLELDPAQLGLALLGASAGAIVAMPATGAFIRRWGSRQVTDRATLLLCLVAPWLALAPTMLLLLLTLFLFGACYGVADVAMNAQAVAIERRYARPIMASFHGVFSVGGLVGAATAGMIAALGIAPAPHLIGVAIALLLLSRVAARFLIDAPEETRAAGVAFARLPRALLIPGVIGFCVFFGEGAMADWSAVYLDRTLGAQAAVAAAGYGAFSLAMAAGRFAGDAMTGKLGPPLVVRSGGLVAAAGLAAVIAARSPLPAIAGFAGVGIGLAAIFPVVLSVAARGSRIAPGTAISAVSTASYTGLLAGPPVIGFVANSAGLRVGIGVVAALCLVAAVLAGSLRTLPEDDAPR
jgi:predicted MFS family arabinose efflux permease